jgi:hypothetical protein
MKRILKVLSVIGMSSVNLYAIGACQMGPDGFSIIPTVSGIGALLGNLGINLPI